MIKKILLIDAHAHIQDCYNIHDYFLSVFENFSKIIASNNISSKWIGVLFLTEVQGLNYFNNLESEEVRDILGKNNLYINKTSEKESTILTDSNEKKIIVIAGKQIIAKNNIEVLALGTTKNFTQGNSIDLTIDEINENGAIPVLPWGVGKWLGKRKQILKHYLNLNESKNFFLGDNGGRPIFWPTPKIFKLGINSNHFVLPGSDALDIPSEFNKTGNYGFYLESKIDLSKPAEGLKKSILNMKEQPTSFGKLETPLKFFSNQIKMQLRKHI